MTLFGNLMPGMGHGQGGHAISLLGMECVSRKGGAGKAPEHSPLSNAAAIRTIEDGFGINNVSNIDLVLRRKSRPDEETMRGYAGNGSRDSRRRDMNEIIRDKSIDHIVRRRHSEPPSRMETTQRGNLIQGLARLSNEADRIGRNVKGRSRSPSPEHESPLGSPRAPLPAIPRRRSRSPPKQIADPVLRPWLTQRPGSLVRSQSSDDVLCTWGQAHAFENMYNSMNYHFEGEPSSPTSQKNMIIPAALPEEPISVDTSQSMELLSDAAEILKMRAMSGGWGSKNSDDGMSTMSTTISGGPTSPMSTGHTSSCFFSETLRNDSTTFGSSASNVMTFAKTVDKRFAQIYERRIKAMVQEEQKKSVKRIG